MDSFTALFDEFYFDEHFSLARHLAKDIAFAIPPIHQGFDFTTPWTRAIRNVLRDRMPKAWKMFPKSDTSSAGEFLVDACWWVDGVGAALIAEFEWSPHWEDIIMDFGKLIVIKAPLKLMIYASAKGEASASVIEGKIKEYLEAHAHHIAGETYMFLDFWPNDYVRAFLWQARANGAASVQFVKHFDPEKFERKWEAAPDSVERPHLDIQ